MCSYAEAMEKKGFEKGLEIGFEKCSEIGFKIGLEKGLKALVQSLKDYTPDFDPLYKAVIRNEDYRDVTREDVMKYYRCERGAV